MGKILKFFKKLGFPEENRQRSRGEPAENGGNPVTADSVFTDDATVYARWDPQPYTVSFNEAYSGGSTSTMS
ncbi:MAG: hypothetical protein IKS45_03100, partial [Thermoguttaceae bacterium]|nr:hypothetical protein [Thermoguttaceae bacterium]